MQYLFLLLVLVLPLESREETSEKDVRIRANNEHVPVRGNHQQLWERIKPYTVPPKEFENDFGTYTSPLLLEVGTKLDRKEDWNKRRLEILEQWNLRLGPWPELIERPKVEVLETIAREGFTQKHVRVQVGPVGTQADGYLLIPPGKGPFPAVLVPFYEPLTSIGQGEKGKGTHDYGYQLVKRGFVTLSIGTPADLDSIGRKTREALTEAGETHRMQPLTLLAYAAANCHTILSQMEQVDQDRIGIVGLSYGGKWSMFSSCLYNKFACAVWSDPGIVFDESNGNVNYWEPWYLGYDPMQRRKPGIPNQENPRTGLYKEMREQGEDLVRLHALMAPRPVLVSGGTEDPPKNWRALNHLREINRLLGYEDRVAMTARATHIPTAEALAIELDFLEFWLKKSRE